MPEADLEDLRQKILADLEEVDLALKTQSQEQEERPRPVLRLLKGGLVGGLILAGVEWFRDYKRIAVALVAAGITISAAVVVDQDDGLPEADPPPGPQTTAPTKPPRPSAKPTGTPAPSTPPRTSPLRTLGTRDIEPTEMWSSTPRTAPPPTRPPTTPTVLITQTLALPVTITPPTTIITIPTITPKCVAEVSTNLLDVDLCLPPLQ